jgi:hypothetical protein
VTKQLIPLENILSRQAAQVTEIRLEIFIILRDLCFSVVLQNLVEDLCGGIFSIHTVEQAKTEESLDVYGVFDLVTVRILDVEI